MPSLKTDCLPLAGLITIITRPQAQGNNLAKLIEGQGGQPILFPTIAIQPLPIPPGFTKDLQDQDLLVFTSKNAVVTAASYLNIAGPYQIAAIGPATATSLSKEGFHVDAFPMEKFDSEHLLSLSLFKNILHKNIMIITGEGGRTLLEEELSKRGANVKKIAVYKRVCSSQKPDVLVQLQNHIKVFVCTSSETLKCLVDILEQSASKQLLTGAHVMVVSKRTEQYAIDIGVSRDVLLLAENATDQTILESLIKWYAKKAC